IVHVEQIRQWWLQIWQYERAVIRLLRYRNDESVGALKKIEKHTIRIFNVINHSLTQLRTPDFHATPESVKEEEEKENDEQQENDGEEEEQQNEEQEENEQINEKE